MPPEHVELIRRLYAETASAEAIEAVKRGARPDYSGFYHEDCVIQNLEAGPITEPYHGQEGVLRWVVESFDVVDRAWLELEEVVEVDHEHVVCRQRLRGTTALGGAEVDFSWVSAFRFRGDRILYAKGFLDWGDALAATHEGLELRSAQPPEPAS